jgi:hypothetical protein
VLWSVSAGIIVSFFFSTNFLAWATNFNPGGSVLFISPLVCGLILGVVTWEYDAIQTVIATILLTITATVGVVFTMISPMLFGVAGFLDVYYIFVAQNAMVSIILILPISLLGSMLGRLFAESTIMSPQYKLERQLLRMETEEWYRMLEERIEAKKRVLEQQSDEEVTGTDHEGMGGDKGRERQEDREEPARGVEG